MNHLKPEQIEIDTWLFHGCIITKQEHPKLSCKYFVFKNDEEQTNVGGAHTMLEAKKLCKKNKCNANHLKFN